MKMKNLFKTQKKNGMTKEEENERLDYVGFILSRKFKYSKLMKAADVDDIAKKEGREVHGYGRRMFPDYDWLFENFVLDRACLFAWQDYKIEAHNLINEYEFKYRSLVTLKEKEAHFKHFPMLIFDRIIIYSDEPLEKELTWIYDYDWTTDDYYETTITFGPCCFLNMGSPLYDLPVLVLSYALGKNKLFFQAKTTSEDLTNERDELIRQQVFTIREKEKNMESTIEELNIAFDGSEKRYSDLKYSMLARDPSLDDEKFARWDKRYDRKNKFESSGIKNGLLCVAVIIIIILALVFIPMLFPPPETPVEIPATARLFSSLIFNRGG